MSLLQRSVEAFPRGRTTGELLALLDVDFDPRKRAAILAELEDLRETGRIRLGADGRWRAVTRTTTAAPPNPRGPAQVGTTGDVLLPMPGTFAASPAAAMESDNAAPATFDAAALLRYYRAALRSDPRGATTETADDHGLTWLLVTGTGPLVPEEGEILQIALPLDGLPGTFREALTRREANESTLAIGWPMAVTRKAGVPVIVPVGLLPAEWRRSGDRLELTVSADDVLLNPDWLRLAARPLGWTEADLRALFATADGSGLPFAEFRIRLREAAASAMRGKLDGTAMASALDPGIAGLHDLCALHLPSESTFTAGAVRDLDRIAAWPDEVRRHTALGVLFEGMDHRADLDVLNAAPLNAEQIEAVAQACRAPLTVVTGPPGTGKSQAITAMAASVLMAGGSVLVASKNHQALDAVEERLGAMAPETGFLVRTLDPARDMDTGFRDALRMLLNEPSRPPRPVSMENSKVLSDLAARRMKAVEARARADELRCELAEVIERIALRSGLPSAPVPRPVGWLRRLVRLLLRRDRLDAPLEDAASLAHLERRREALEAALDRLDISDDPVALTEDVALRVTALLPLVLGSKTALGETDRRALGNAQANLELAGATAPLSRDLADAVLRHRPLWLASILGTPKRIPLEPALFDLVIFDEASQCDIASALPLLARAKRAVIVGDDRQLSFIAQLGIAQDRNLMKAQGLDPAGLGRYAQSRRSLFDLASMTEGAARVLLRDQYRSAPEIVGYISDQFYGGKLRPAGDPDRFRLPRGARPGIAWTDVPAPPTPQRGNVNPAEVQAIVAHLRLLLLEQDYAGSVGVITPFRPQVAMLSEALRAALPELRLEAAEFRVSTVDGFQGQERDLILFSPVIGPSAAASAVQFVQKDWRRMNVAISRARAVAHVFGDLSYARSGKVDSLRKLAARATEPRAATGREGFDSDWERRVYHALKARGLEPVAQYEIAGRRLDFALFGQTGIKLDLEVDGRLWHSDSDGRRKRSDLWRDHQLRSLGWRVRRFWVDELSNDLEGCLDIVERDLT